MNLFLSFDPDQLAHIKLLKKDEIYILFQDDMKLVIQMKELIGTVENTQVATKKSVIEVAIGRDFNKFGGDRSGYIRTHIQMEDIETAESELPIETEIQLIHEGRM